MLIVIGGISTLLITAWFADMLMRRQSAAIRHALWTSATLACLVLPGLRAVAPRRTVAPLSPAAAVLPISAPVHVSVNNARVIDGSRMAEWIWLVGSLLCAASLTADFVRLRRLMRGSRTIPFRGPVPVRVNAHVASPFLAGFFHPEIIVPADFEVWPGPRRRAVIAHELAHVRRRDFVILLAGRILTVAYWFHPLCWFALQRLRTESERACDDAALRLEFMPSKYAGHLVSVARMFNPQPAIPMAAMSQLEFRVKSILDPSTSRSPVRGRHWTLLALFGLCVLLPLAALAWAQQTSGGTSDLSGFVIDPTGAYVPRATVIASNPTVGNREIATTDATGTYAFHSIPAGRYTLEVRAPGFTVYQQNNVVLEAGVPLAVNTKLSVGHLTETLSVIAQGTPLPQAQPAGPPTRIRIGGNVQAAKLLRQVRPTYPADLQAQGIEGTVLIDAVISKEGVPLSVKVQNSAVNPEFANAALDAVQQWRYSPTLLNGEPVEVVTTVTIDFKLKQ